MDTRKLDLNLLVTLQALLAERNVTRAAEKLGLSQPAVSAQLARLRDLFNDPLLIPARRGMTLTQRAEELQRPLVEAIARARDVLSVGATFDPATSGMTAAIAGSDHAQIAWLAPFAVWLRQHAPAIRLAIRQADPATLEREMEQGEVDLALLPDYLAPGALLFRKFRTEPYVLIARRGHPAVRGGVSASQALALQHVITEPGKASFSGLADAALGRLGQRRQVVMSCATFQSTTEVVTRTDLVALVPEGIARHRADALQILDAPFDMPVIEMLMLWHPRTHIHPGQRWLRDALAGQAAGQGIAAVGTGV